MTDAQQTLMTAIGRIGAEAERMLGVLPAFNNAEMGLVERMTVLAETAERVAAVHAGNPGREIADALESLRSGVMALGLPEDDGDLGETYALREMRGVEGRLFMAVVKAIEAATALGLTAENAALPADLSAGVPRAGNKDLLRGIAEKLDDVVQQLDRLEEAGAEPTEFTQQGALLAFYIGKMRVQIDLARMQLSVGDRTVDFAALTRATGTMSELTSDFVATIREWADRAAAGVMRIARGIGGRVRTVVVGLRDAAREIARRRADVSPPPEPAQPDAEPEAPSGDFDLDRVHEMIRRGETPPQAWWPFIRELSLGTKKRYTQESSDFSDLRPVAPLTALRSLTVWNSRVSDLTPLAGRDALQSLDLRDTKVSNLTPLAGLGALQSLNLSFTQVSDLTPLAGLDALQGLNLSFTQVSDLTPLAGLDALRFLDLKGTLVSDLTPVQNIRELAIIGGPSSGPVAAARPVAAAGRLIDRLFRRWR